MTRAWLQKELRDHSVALIGWFVLAAILYGLMLVQISLDEARGSWLEAVRRFTLAWAVIGVTYLAGRLIRREYSTRTQLFLESLPVSRARVLTIKLLLGAGLIAVLFVIALALAAAFAWETQRPSPRLLAFVALRALSVAWFAWALLSMAALLGRYRVPLLVLLALTVWALTQSTSLEPANVGPARLLGEEMPYETVHFPWAALVVTWVFIAIFVAASYALLLARDGTLTIQLSDRMSHRDKVYVACVLLAFMVGIGTIDAAKTPEPYRLEEATVAERNGTHVEIGADVEPELARRLADDLLAALDQARTYVGLRWIPGVAVLPTRDLDPSETQRAFVANASGIVLRAALWDERLDRSRLATICVHDVVSEAHRDRAMAESLHWMLDAYANLHGELHVRGDAARELLWLRAAYARPAPLETFLSTWDIAQEQLGSCVAGASAASVLLAIESLAGPDAVQRVVRRILDREAQRSWYAGDPELGALFLEETGVSLDRIEQAWRERLEQVRATRSDVLGPLHATVAVPDLHHLSGRTFELRHRVVQTPPSPPGVRYSVRFSELGPIDVPEDERDFEVQQALVNAEATALPRALVEGTRWLWVVELPSDALGCPVRILAERREVR